MITTFWLGNFILTADHFGEALQGYSLEQLRATPDDDGWSMGQLYRHLIDDTNFYIQQMEVCVSSGDNANKNLTDNGKAILARREFPDARIKGEANHKSLPQPESKESLVNEWSLMQNAFSATALKINSSKNQGKALHPGFGYMSANEWLQLADMHLRHHLRQKNRIDQFLRGENKKAASSGSF